MTGARPRVAPEPGLPERITVYEVGPRDGLQNEATTVPTAIKAEFVRRLLGAGLGVVEVTSFVRPDRVPQLADATELLAALGPVGASSVLLRAGSLPPPGSAARLPVLVPNERGLERALAAGVTEVAVFASVTESFARRNLGRSVAESLAGYAAVVERARAAGLRVRGYASMCFGDPWEGEVALDAVVDVGARLLAMGCEELSLGDTIGVATPGHVTALLGAFGAAGIGVERLAVHFHDTYGQALANTLAALRAGVTTVDASAGGLGGCPFARSATGNLATEDLVWMLDGLGVETGVDLGALVTTSAWLSGVLGRPSPSRVVRALS